MAPALPLLLPQALWIRRTALRLPDAAQPWQGTVACSGAAETGEPFKLLLIGESTVAGVGVDSQAEALSGQLAMQLAATLQRPVCWQACGCNGARASDLIDGSLELTDARWDAVVIVLGVNDTTHLTPRWRWRKNIRQLVRRFAGSCDRVVLTGVPPLGEFSALPQPLRGWFGLRAGLLDQDLKAVARLEGVTHLPFGFLFAPGMLARDGYHPSAEGYRVWAAHIVGQF
ncbi:Lysophospholipase L1 [Halopseudomonas xinjiangensis]|uniref:Lysophospholipase L1 n=1 Tax=Halopseudomonas xinjiangensis TaxID=487184 RepID=A0A1H1VGU2_9GAMM|nr:SGNH/GDSL hydrolase family protein [Halopseudomonas xinjiangensis]SDS84144.1 Lysophospholipase L1 [Halopseudomonas xinjiangensis]